MGEERGFTSHTGVFLPSELSSQYRCLPKTDDNDRTNKNDANTLSWPMIQFFFLDKYLIGAIQITCFGILKTVLVEILSYMRKITYHLLLIVFSINKLISMQDVGHNMLHLHVAQQLPITLSSWTSKLSPTNEKDAELNWQFPFGIHLKQKILPDLLKLRTKAEKSDKIFIIYINKRSKGSAWQ